MTLRNPSHPSVSLRRSLEAEGWSVVHFATQLGVSRSTASRLLNGHCGITPSVALALERIGWSNADFWTRRQANYEMTQTRQRAANPLSKHTS